MNNHDSADLSTPTSFLSGLPQMELFGGCKLEKWRRAVGISRTAAWRLRKEGKLAVIVRYGTVYVTAETIRNFLTNDGSKPRTFAMNITSITMLWQMKSPPQLN